MLLLLLALWFWSAPFSASAERLGQANLTAQLTPDGVRATINLDHGVTRLAFSQADVVRNEDIAILTPGLAWSADGAAITATQTFRRVELLVRPAARERDGKYPAFFRVGAGGVLYTPALKADASWRTRLRIVTSRGETRLPVDTPNIDGSLYIGPVAYVTHGAEADLIASPDTPPLLRERITRSLATALRTYSTRLHAELPTRPIVVMTQAGPGEGFVGDVTPGPFVSLRFYGPTAEQLSNSYRVTRFVSHEVFHFWNGSLVTNADGTPSWLHEGGADYAALLVGLESGALDDAGMRGELGDALTHCRQGLEHEHDAGMNNIAFLSMNVRYPCGIVIQWAASLEAERAAHGGFFDIWAHMISAARARPQHTFTLADFYEGAGFDANAPPTAIRLLTVEQGAARWPQLIAALEGLGADISSASTSDTRREAVIFHLLRQVCASGPFGFYNEATGIRLNANNTCTLLAENDVLTSVEGANLPSVSEATFATVQTRCAARQDVRIVLNANRPVWIPCHADLPAAREAYIVNRSR